MLQFPSNCARTDAVHAVSWASPFFSTSPSPSLSHTPASSCRAAYLLFSHCWMLKRPSVVISSEKQFFSFYEPGFCLILPSEHKVKHKSIFCKSPELGFSFVSQHSWLQACVSYIWDVDRTGIIVLSFSPLPESVTVLTTSSVLLYVCLYFTELSLMSWLKEEAKFSYSSWSPHHHLLSLCFLHRQAFSG